MKVGFNVDAELRDSQTGKLKFIIRLADEMKSRGIKIDNENPDVFLTLPKYPLSSTAKVNVLRLDGITYKTTTQKNSKKRTKNLLRLIDRSDALVYQSVFCKTAHVKFLGVNPDKSNRIIFNGVDPDEFLPRNPKNYFLASAKWRKRKRIKSVIGSFLKALDMGLDADLIIAGDRFDINNYKHKHPRIKYLGWRDRNQMKKLLSEAISTLHLNWLDCFPNSMVESIVASCPVIYTDSGGQIELGGNSGISVEDKKWDFKPYNDSDCPSINEEEVAVAMIRLKRDRMVIDERKDLYISEICNQYINFFENLLERE